MADELVKPESGVIAPMQDLPEWVGLHKQVSISTFDTKTVDGLKLLTRMGKGADQDLASHIGKEIRIASFYMAPYEKVDQSGEIIQLVFCGLVDPDEVVYGSSSIGVRRSLLQFAQLFGWKTWNPPLTVRVNATKVNQGQFHTLEYVSGGLPPIRPTKKG